MNAAERVIALTRKHGRTLLGLCVLILLAHNVFGAHGFLAMRRTRKETERVKQNIERLNNENKQLADEVKALKSDPHAIEKIARDDLGLARPGEVIIKIPPSMQPAPASRANP